VRTKLAIAVKLALDAGREILKLYRREMQVDQKADEGPVTAADRSADRLIREGLRASFPEDAVLTEESPDRLDRLSSRRLWIVDPLDGTRQFVKGVDEFAVMIGLAIDGVPRLGVVHLPAERLTYAGADGEGVFEIDASGSRRPVEIEPWNGGREPIAVAVGRSSAGSRTCRVVEALGSTRIVRSGSVGRKAMLIMSGQADAYFTLGTRSRHWDSCAPEALIRLAGGRFTDTTGRGIVYNTEQTRNERGLLACRRGLTGSVVAAVRSVAGPSTDGSSNA